MARRLISVCGHGGYRLHPGSLPPGDVRSSELVKRLYGQATSSHGGRCRNRRKGLLDEIPHRRLIRGVVIVRAEDAKRVVRLLETFQADLHARKVELGREDREAPGQWRWEDAS